MGSREQDRAAAGNAETAKVPAASSFALPSIRVWGAWLGISALLALSGFIVKIAQEQFLGISLIQWGPAELSTTAGRWLIDTVLLCCQVCMQHPLWTMMWAIAVLAAIVISLEFEQDSMIFRVSRAVVIALAFLSLGLLLMRVQLPVTTIEDWLTTSLNDRFPSSQEGKLPNIGSSLVDACIPSGTASPNPTVARCKQPGHIPLTSRYFHDKQLYFNQTIFVSKAANIGRCLTADHVGLPSQLRNLAKTPEDWPRLADDAEKTIQRDYVLEIACCLGVWIVLYMQRPSLVDDTFDRAIDVTTLFVSFFLLPFCTLLVPYSYGKLISSAQFTSATVQQKLLYPEKGGPYYLIERSDNLISVLSLDGTIPKITVIRNDQVASMELTGKVDVLKAWNDQCWFNPEASPPPTLGPSMDPQTAPLRSDSHPGD